MSRFSSVFFSDQKCAITIGMSPDRSDTVDASRAIILQPLGPRPGHKNSMATVQAALFEILSMGRSFSTRCHVTVRYIVVGPVCMTRLCYKYSTAGYGPLFFFGRPLPRASIRARARAWEMVQYGKSNSFCSVDAQQAREP